ncbi:protein translocase subunit SecF [Candidatus Woesebacteria bacterium]|nr:MAG: protein translocase subunit SecF [Candidatus Woesebacteria bacterium]
MNWLKYKYVYLSLSLGVIVFCIFALVSWKLKLGLDFTGGTLIEYKYEGEISSEDAINEFAINDVEVNSIQQTGDNTYLFRLKAISQDQKIKVDKIFKENIFKGESSEQRFETVGPSIGPELIKKTAYAALFAAIVILLWVAYQFKSIKFGLSAILAMFHDSFILIGAFSVLGKYFGAEVDFLFVTALLTTLSFSVHDTIVVFDRIREVKRNNGGELEEIANIALTETMVRSLNNSLTIIFMLSSLLLLGGITIKWFAVALLIGTVLGTYSSPFIAVPLLIVFNNIIEKYKKTKK